MAMAVNLLTLLATTFVLTLVPFSAGNKVGRDLTLTVFNNCPYPVWPAIQPNSGFSVLEKGGFLLPSLTHRSFLAPYTPWSGRIWGRTGCSYNHRRNQFTCATGDCGGRLECGGLGGKPPVTLAQFSLHNGRNDLASYGVSLVDGFNVPMTVTPHQGKGVCPLVGCQANLLASCPPKLQVRQPRDGTVVACMSGCQAFGTDELCCRNRYNSPATCRPSFFSQIFKKACPSTFTYAHDSTPSLLHECASPRELKVTFCP
ncbi:hypothetical protein SAY87_016662 [Trapa incisa]|uniref:Osmotin-like protein n=1 Tax=Trapa incisa TaxID=236973 RepID=A0AAN7QXP3_9MYRT|nr:hypothetical protein SAY87_016662 [Trapa incisa]